MNLKKNYFEQKKPKATKNCILYLYKVQEWENLIGGDRSQNVLISGVKYWWWRNRKESSWVPEIFFIPIRVFVKQTHGLMYIKYYQDLLKKIPTQFTACVIHQLKKTSSSFLSHGKMELLWVGNKSSHFKNNLEVGRFTI